MDLKERIKAKLQTRSQPDKCDNMSPQELALQELRQALGTCFLCKGDLSRHALANLANHVVSSTELNQEGLEFFLNQLKKQNWFEATQISNFNPEQNNISAHVLRCPQGAYGLCYFRDPFELFEMVELIDYDVIPSESLVNLLPLIESKWKYF